MIESFDFIYPETGVSEAKPLSWHLTRPQMEEIAKIGLEAKFPRTDVRLDDLSTEVWVGKDPETAIKRRLSDAWSTLIKNVTFPNPDNGEVLPLPHQALKNFLEGK